MSANDWHLTDDVLGFLRSRPAIHTMALTATLRADAVFGRSATAVFYRFPGRGIGVTPLTPAQADSLAAYLLTRGWPVPSVSADHATATTFAAAWQRHTGATPRLRVELNLYRLGTLVPPSPMPPGQARDPADPDLVVRWCHDFAADVGDEYGPRFAEKHYTFWEAPDGTPVSMAGVNPLVGGHVRVDPVYTPAAHRGHGYAAAVTTAVTRTALTAGATEVVLFTDPANPTSNALYRRLGYTHLTTWSAYDFRAPQS